LSPLLTPNGPSSVPRKRLLRKPLIFAICGFIYQLSGGPAWMTAATPVRKAPTAVQRPQSLGPATGRTVDLTEVKAEARRSLASGDVGRELVLALPDRMDVVELDALFPTLLRVLRDRSRGAGP
jgi:hypothetical protein